MAFGRGYSPSYVPWDAKPAAALINHAARSSRPLGGLMLFEEVKAEKLGFMPTPKQIAADLAILRRTVAQSGRRVPVYGVCNQDSDQAPTLTDNMYRASASAIDVVQFSYYMNNAVGAYLGPTLPLPCPYEPHATARFILEPANRRTIERDLHHYVNLSRTLGKPAYLIAAAPCTHAPEGTGWGAVNAHSGLLWYADALGRTARAGVAVFARQTIFGGSYGLLDNSTYMPTPSYWVAVLHKQLLGRGVFQVSVSTARAPDNLTVYAHCTAGGGGLVTLMALNFLPTTEPLALPHHTGRFEWVLEGASHAPAPRPSPSANAGSVSKRLLSRTTLLNGKPLVATADGSLPNLAGKSADSSSEFVMPPYSVGFAVLDGTSAAKHCATEAAPWWETALRRIAPPRFRDAEYDITHFGARGDGSTDSWAAIRKAIDQCAADGGGRVLVPSGKYLVKGPIRLASHTQLHLDDGATIHFSGVPADFLRDGLTLCRWEGIEMLNYAPLIYGHNLTNVAITGSGVINGSGSVAFAAWKALQKPDQVRCVRYHIRRPSYALHMLTRCACIRCLAGTCARDGEHERARQRAPVWRRALPSPAIRAADGMPQPANRGHHAGRLAFLDD